MGLEMDPNSDPQKLTSLTKNSVVRHPKSGVPGPRNGVRNGVPDPRNRGPGPPGIGVKKWGSERGKNMVRNGTFIDRTRILGKLA